MYSFAIMWSVAAGSGAAATIVWSGWAGCGIFHSFLRSRAGGVVVSAECCWHQCCHVLMTHARYWLLPDQTMLIGTMLQQMRSQTRYIGLGHTLQTLDFCINRLSQVLSWFPTCWRCWSAGSPCSSWRSAWASTWGSGACRWLGNSPQFLR